MDGSPTRLRSWAERLLFGDTLDDKLWAPARWVDARPGAPVTLPERPGRPPGLDLGPTEPAAPATASALRDPAARGRVLHAFANHELLALELMALALLRFPDAPPGFRRGLARTMLEEQRHLRAYLERMRGLGVTLGERPLGGFFWRVMAPMPSPLDFVVHMSLTFEQANLDFALEYAARMRAAGDEDTARVLDEVRADEIGHVKLGLVWFQRWRARGPSLFEAHRRALRAPITARRARGLGLDRAGRRRAGLPDDYVEQLASFEASRGRPPVVHWFDPTAELAHGVRGSYTPSRAIRVMTDDLEALPAFAAARHDVLLLRRAPSRAYRRGLAEAGLVFPEWIVRPTSGVSASTVPHPRLAAVRPWGWSSRSRAELAALVARADQDPPPPEADAIVHAKTTWAPVRAALREQLGAPPWLDDASTQGEVVRDVDHALAAIERHHAMGYAWVVVKAPYGTSGRNAQRVDRGGLTVAQRGWLSRILAQQGAALVEPWLDRVCDVSLRMTVEPGGRGRVEHVGRFITDARGQFLGSVLGSLPRAVPSAVARVLNGDGRDPRRLERVYAAVAAAVADRAARHGYVGPIGVDGLVYRDRAGSMRLRPLVEVNVRPTLGHVAYGLERQLARGRAGLWVVFRLADLPPGSSATQAVARARRRLPTVVRGQPPRLHQGVVPTTDLERARTAGTVLLVADRRADALRALDAGMPAVAARWAQALDPRR